MLSPYSKLGLLRQWPTSSGVWKMRLDKFILIIIYFLNFDLTTAFFLNGIAFKTVHPVQFQAPQLRFFQDMICEKLEADFVCAKNGVNRTKSITTHKI